MSRMPQIRVVQASDAKAVRRVMRRPQHPFSINSRPFEITPFMIAPVLPADTLTNLLMQSRVVSDPVVNPLIGWWKEYYFFYVPLLSMVNSDNIDGEIYNSFDRSQIESMFIDEDFDLTTSGAAGANAPAVFVAKGTVDFVTPCLSTVTREFFRDEDDQAITALDRYYPAYFDRRNWLQSVDAASGTGHQARDSDMPGEDEIEAEAHTILGAADDTRYDEWLILKDAGMTALTYQDYLREQGVSVPRSEDTATDGSPIVRPELLRFVRKWTYPTNHIDPTTGTPTSAVSWSCVERADKHRLFKQPGFLFGVTVSRPKVYLGSQKGTATGLLTNWLRWPSVVNADRPYRSLVQVTASLTDGPLQNQSQDYWVDVKDLFLYGEEFRNQVAAVADNHALVHPSDLSSEASRKASRVPTLAQVKSFFVDVAGTKNFLREDGVVHLGIKSRIGRDTTPGGG
jgi:hypothetical protein